MMPRPSRPPRLSGQYARLDVITELLEAVFDANATRIDDALELLILAEYIQAEIHRRHRDELRALLLDNVDDAEPGSERLF